MNWPKQSNIKCVVLWYLFTMAHDNGAFSGDLLGAFHIHYSQFENAVREVMLYPTDSTVLTRLGDDLDEFASLAIEVGNNIYYYCCDCEVLYLQHSHIFDNEELLTLCTNLTMMQSDICLCYEEMLDASHHRYPVIVQTIRTGRHGRPRIHIDPLFLQWAYSHQSTSGIHRFLNVGCSVVQNALIEYGIAEPQQNPFAPESGNEQMPRPGDLIEDHLLNPEIPPPIQLPNDVLGMMTSLVSVTGPVSGLTDNQLDDLIIHLQSHFRCVGLSMLDGMLRWIGHRVPCERIQESLMRIDPVQRVFQRIRI
jgi:hypothetical protein